MLGTVLKYSNKTRSPTKLETVDAFALKKNKTQKTNMQLA